MFVTPGCILAELHTGYPLFPGENESEQLACIMELLGPPPPDLLLHATRKRLFFGKLIMVLICNLEEHKNVRPLFLAVSKLLLVAFRWIQEEFCIIINWCFIVIEIVILYQLGKVTFIN